MAIESNIYSQIRAPQQTNRLAQFAQMQQIEAAQNQNRLAELAFGEKEREAAGARAMDAVYRDATGPDGTIDRKKLYAGIAQTSGSKLPGVQKGFAETDKAEVEAQKNKIVLQREKLSMAGQILGSVKDQASYDAARQTAAANGLDIANMPPQYSPDFVAGKLKEAMTVKEQLEQHWKQMEYSTPNANAVLSAKTSTDNNASSNATARRGQNMTAGTAAAGRAQSASQHAATMSKPFEVAGPDGSPVLVRQDKQGNITTVPGYGPKGNAGKPPTEFQGKSAGFGARAEQADKILSGLEKEGVTNTGIIKSIAQGVGGMVPFMGDKVSDAVGSGFNVLPRALGGPNAKQQQTEQARRDFVNAVLRQESGAAIAESEFANAVKQYFPQPGDDASVIKQKDQNRKLAIQGFKNNAGRAAFSAPTGASGDWSIEEVK